jgi:hypothetical protein
MKKIILLTLFAFVPLLANATPLTIMGGGVIPVTANNDYLDGSYNIGGNLYLTQMSTLTFTNLNHEAGYSNDFIFGTDSGQTINNKDAVGTSFSVSGVSGGLLDFDFYSYGVSAGISNGFNQPFGSYQSFAIQLNPAPYGSGYDAILAFDDSGASIDDNHDDLIIGINVPEPATLAILGLSLVGFGFSKRNKKA